MPVPGIHCAHRGERDDDAARRQRSHVGAMALQRWLRPRLALLAFCWAAAAPFVAAAHGSDAGRPTAAPAASGGLPVARELPTLAARYEVRIEHPVRSGRPARRTTWYFFREPQRVALVADRIEQAWYRDREGRVRFERTLHDEQRVVEYSTGELAALGVAADWQSVATLLDGAELARLKPLGPPARHARATQVWAGALDGTRLRVEWRFDLGIPSVVERREPDGTVVRLTMMKGLSAAPAEWPQPGAAAINYLRIDAADFGDMQGDPAVRRAEAMDVRQGWRRQHRHD